MSTNMPALALEAERPYLFAVAYRLLGSASDAEDMVQEALARAPEPDEVRSLRAYLTTVVTRLCLDELRSARRKREAYVGPWLPEPVLTDGLDAPQSASLEHEESVSIAFLAMLDRLSPQERVVFVLREVFELEFSEIAAIVERGEVACRKLLSRARESMAQRLPRVAARTEAQLALSSAFFQALASGDLHRLLPLLSDDVVSVTDHGGKASSAQNALNGPDRVGRFYVGLAQKAKRIAPQVRFEPAFVNGAPALLQWGAQGQLETALVLRVEERGEGPRIVALSAIRNPEKLRALARNVRLGL